MGKLQIKQRFMDIKIQNINYHLKRSFSAPMVLEMTTILPLTHTHTIIIIIIIIIIINNNNNNNNNNNENIYYSTGTSTSDYSTPPLLLLLGKSSTLIFQLFKSDRYLLH